MSVLEVVWAEQYMKLLAAGGLVRKGGRPVNTPLERWALAAAAYARAYAALAGDKVLLDVSPLRERLDQAASKTIELLLAELSEPEVTGLATFWIFTMSQAGQQFRQDSGKTGRGSN